MMSSRHHHDIIARCHHDIIVTPLWKEYHIVPTTGSIMKQQGVQARASQRSGSCSLSSSATSDQGMCPWTASRLPLCTSRSVSVDHDITTAFSYTHELTLYLQPPHLTPPWHSRTPLPPPSHLTLTALSSHSSLPTCSHISHSQFSPLTFPTLSSLTSHLGLTPYSHTLTLEAPHRQFSHSSTHLTLTLYSCFPQFCDDVIHGRFPASHERLLKLAALRIQFLEGDYEIGATM